jgi:hypothetical protein
MTASVGLMRSLHAGRARRVGGSGGLSLSHDAVVYGVAISIRGCAARAPLSALRARAPSRARDTT